MRSVGVGLLAAVLVLGGAACGDSSQAVGAGDDVDFCAGYRYFDGLKEPDPANRREAISYADGFQRIIDRIEPRFEFKNQANETIRITPEVAKDLKVMQDAMIELRNALRDADNEAETRALVTGFSDNTAFRAADQRITDYYRATCR